MPGALGMQLSMVSPGYGSTSWWVPIPGRGCQGLAQPQPQARTEKTSRMA